MSTVNNATSTDPLLAALGANGSKATSAADDMGDRFLTLLTTQLRNQDPLNPLDNAEVTTQLAQINTVTGIEKLNTALSNLLSAYNDSKSMQAANLIGKNVLVAGKNLVDRTDGSKVGGILLDSNADKVTINIVNAAGVTVQTEQLENKKAGSFAFIWDGKDADGNVAPAGTYTFKVEAKSGNDPVKATALQVGTVDALVRGKNGFQLDLGDAGTFGFDEVQQVF